ncbi:4Fe-4S binding protein [Anaerobaca lacustris]|uniref:4Fe-4S binding protein n=1 Tax=Anaerobaca lacustris TaxID=3044600 RepID=UPI003D76945C
MCPFGAAQELVGLADGPRRALPAKIARLLRIVRSGLLLSITVALLAGVGFDLATVEPFAVFSARAASGWVLFLAGTCLLVSVFHPRLWCRALCPTGRIVQLLMWGLLRSRRTLTRPVAPSRYVTVDERLSWQSVKAAGDT